MLATVLGLNLEKELYLLAAGLVSFGAIQFIAAALKAKQHTSGGFYNVVNDVFTMPEAMKQLHGYNFLVGLRYLLCGFTAPQRLLAFITAVPIPAR